MMPVLIPAAGASSRMRGADKLMMDIDGEPLLRRQVSMARAVSDDVRVALPSRPHPRYAAVRDLDVRTFEVSQAAEGISASLRVLFASPVSKGHDLARGHTKRQGRTSNNRGAPSFQRLSMSYGRQWRKLCHQKARTGSPLCPARRQPRPPRPRYTGGVGSLARGPRYLRRSTITAASCRFRDRRADPYSSKPVTVCSSGNSAMTSSRCSVPMPRKE